MWIRTLGLAAVALAVSIAAAAERHSGRPRLEVEVRTVAGERLAGATVSLCALETEGQTVGEACRIVVSDDAGESVFDGVPPGLYSVSAELTGFATTTVHPLSIAGADPIAPDEVVVVLNAVCFHCVPTRRR